MERMGGLDDHDPPGIFGVMTDWNVCIEPAASGAQGGLVDRWTDGWEPAPLRTRRFQPGWPELDRSSGKSSAECAKMFTYFRIFSHILAYSRVTRKCQERSVGRVAQKRDRVESG